MAAKYAVSLMALLGSVAAQGYSNSSSIASTTSSVSPQYTDGAMPTVGGVTFEIQMDTSYQGSVLNLARKRQADSSIQSCLSTCAADTDCVGTAYVEDTGSCIYYSEIDADTQADTPGTDFALVQSRAGASSTSSVFNGTTPVTSNTRSATRTPGVSLSSNSTGSATGSATRPAGVTGGSGNSTTRATGRPSASRTSSGSGSSTTPGAPISTPSTLITINGVLFLIEINISYSGITIDFAILAKRAGESLDQCLTTCAANSNCAGTSFTDNECTFYTSITEDSQVVANGTTFATVISRVNANGAGVNGTTPGGAASNVTAESLICPAYSGAVLTSSLDITFAISCGHFLIGTTYDAISTLTRRQTIQEGLPQTISNCVDLCSAAEGCVGVTFEASTETCSYYSDVTGSIILDGYDSAVRVQDNNGNGSGEILTTTTVVAGQITTTTVAGPTTTEYVGSQSTATVYTTIVSTITAYAGGPTAYPSGAVITSIYPVSTITYVNSVSTITLPSMPTVTITAGGYGSGAGAAAPTSTVVVYQTVDQNGNVIGSSTADAAAGGVAGGVGAYPTVTVYSDSCSTPAAAPMETTWTTIYV